MAALFQLGCAVIVVLSILSSTMAFIQNGNAFMAQNSPNKVMCTGTSLMIYYDCRVCACPKQNRAARCFNKSCDLRTKDSGQCSPTILKLDDDQNCPKQHVTTCATDNDCPGNSLCCFDFCYGTKCSDPIPLDFGTPKHLGRGYP